MKGTVMDASPGRSRSAISLLAKSKPSGSVLVPRYVLDDHPEAYCLQVRGDCMAPAILDGDSAILSPSAKILEGAVAAFYFRGGVEAKLKRLASPFRTAFAPGSNCSPTLTLEMDNPHKYLFVDPSDLEGAHVCVGVVRGAQFIALTPSS